jgi:1,4-alpha-glucan branching enzyme
MITTLKLLDLDPWLAPYSDVITSRYLKYIQKRDEILYASDSLVSFASAHHFYGLHQREKGWVLREWAPNATEIYLIGAFSDWKKNSKYLFSSIGNGNWEILVDKDVLKHGELYKLMVCWQGGEGERLPAYATRMVQDEQTHIFTAQVWDPAVSYQWKDQNWRPHNEPPIIYEAHVGMSSSEEKVSTYKEFKDNVLPRIIKGGYNTIQLMAVQEHPYYGSFGYHVSNFFAASSRFGTPEELKALIDEAHRHGINVIMDLVHSHAVKNEVEGLGRFDGDTSLYFYPGDKGFHPAWDSRCFDYGKNEIIRFLLSNVRYWLEIYHFDGFRFDGVTSMLYQNHGLEINFTCYDDYFKGQEDEEAIVYLTLANELIHQVKPGAISVAEEMSGYPGLCGDIDDGGMGFNYRLSMGIPDFWIKMVKDTPDEEWSMGLLYHELTQHRVEEKTISYAESHDQALVGDKTLIFRLVDKEMYFHMSKMDQNLVIDRGMALHKMIRMLTFTTSTGGYLNFMGNEFGHPEWIDFPRDGNNWSYKYARRQWGLADNQDLKYHYLNDFDRDMIHLMRQELLVGLPGCFLIQASDSDKVLAFSRGNLVFVYNFHPTRSYTDYGISVEAGKYQIVLDSDREVYGGFGRIDDYITYYSIPLAKQSQVHQLKIYLPNRTGLIFKKMATPKVY